MKNQVPECLGLNTIENYETLPVWLHVIPQVVFTFRCELQTRFRVFAVPYSDQQRSERDCKQCNSYYYREGKYNVDMANGTQHTKGVHGYQEINQSASPKSLCPVSAACCIAPRSPAPFQPHVLHLRSNFCVSV